MVNLRSTLAFVRVGRSIQSRMSGIGNSIAAVPCVRKLRRPVSDESGGHKADQQGGAGSQPGKGGEGQQVEIRSDGRSDAPSGLAVRPCISVVTVDPSCRTPVIRHPIPKLRAALSISEPSSSARISSQVRRSVPGSRSLCPWIAGWKDAVGRSAARMGQGPDDSNRRDFPLGWSCRGRLHDAPFRWKRWP
jgi:hypothetical protein